MKTAEDEAFEDIERRQGGGFPAKRAMAADRDALFEKFEVEQPAQNPVAFICQGNLYMAEDVDEYCTATHIPLYTIQPKREWASLTADQIHECVENSYFHTAWSSEIDIEMLAQNIDAALQKLNT